MKRFAFAVVALCAFTATVAPARADVIYAGTCYPDSLHTDGHPIMFASHQILHNYFASGLRLTLTEPMQITGINGVGLGTDDWGDFWPHLNVFAASGEFSREEMFANDPLLGNVYHGEMGLNGDPTEFGQSLGFTTYYTQLLPVEGVILQPGDYILSVTIDQVTPGWSWLETDVPLSTSIWRWSGDPPGTYTEYSGQQGYTTASMALDIMASPVPEPATLALLGSALLFGGRRRRAV